MKVLLLAGAGGQQAPLFAALGADVTVMDLSGKMLAQDKMVAERENLKIIIEKGNICDLSRFADDSFDLILNPPSLFYVPDVVPVFKECHRVLKNGGIFMASLANPINYMCNYDDEKKAYYICNPLPFISHEHDEGCGGDNVNKCPRLFVEHAPSPSAVRLDAEQGVRIYGER